MIKRFSDIRESSTSTKKERSSLGDHFLRNLYKDKEWVESIAIEVQKISGSKYKMRKLDADEIDVEYRPLYGTKEHDEWPSGDVWQAEFEMANITDSRRNMDNPYILIVSMEKAKEIADAINKGSIHLGGEVYIKERTREMWPYEMLNYLNRNGWSKKQIAEKWYKPHRGWQLIGQLGIE